MASNLTGNGRAIWTVQAVRQLGLTTDVETAGQILGIGRTTAYALAKAGVFPVTVLHVGRRYIVSVSDLLHVLNADQP